MVKVENKETLRLLTKRFMKMNRARNIIAVIAIMLTSLLFTSLFVGSVSMILSKRATEIKQFMDSSHAIAQNLSEEDAERLQKTIEQDEDVERYGSGIFLGAGMDERFGFSVDSLFGAWHHLGPQGPRRDPRLERHQYEDQGRDDRSPR